MDLVQSEHAAQKSQSPLNYEFYNNNDGFFSPTVDGGHRPLAELPLNFDGHPQSEHHAIHNLPSHIRSPFINVPIPRIVPTAPLPTTIDPKLLQLNHDYVNQSKSCYQPIYRKNGHLEKLCDNAFTSYSPYSRSGAQPTLQPATLTSAPTVHSSPFSTSFTIGPVGHAIQPNFVNGVKEMGGGDFKCGFIGCSKIHDRRSRAEACEYRHYGIKAFQCSGACGNSNCSTEFTSEENFRRHCLPQDMRTISCPICGKNVLKQNISRHRARLHSA